MDSSDLVARIQTAKQLVEERRNARLRAETKLETLTAEISNYKTRLNSLGVDPSKLDDLIGQSKQDLEEKLTELEAKLNDEQS